VRRTERRRRALASLAQMELEADAQRLAFDTFASAFTRVTDANERALVVQGLRKTLQAAPTERLVEMARVDDAELAAEARWSLLHAVRKEDGVLQTLLTQRIVPIEDVVRHVSLAPYHGSGSLLGKRLLDVVTQDLQRQEAADQVRWLRRAAAASLLELDPGLPAFVRERLAGDDPEQAKDAARIVARFPRELRELGASLRPLAQKSADARRAAWAALVRVDPTELPSAIVAGHVGEAGAFPDQFESPLPHTRIARSPPSTSPPIRRPPGRWPMRRCTRIVSCGCTASAASSASPAQPACPTPCAPISPRG
jgi:hypothetical protein